MDSVYDKKYNRLAFLSNDAENGMQFYDDALTTSTEAGLYTYEFKVRKTHPQVETLVGGNYIETETIHGKQLLMVINNTIENGQEKTIFCEDTNIQFLNSYVEPIEAPASPQSIDFYINHTLERTDMKVRLNEATDSLVLEFGSEQRTLERLREIATAFGVELSFDIDFEPGRQPQRFVSFLKKRTEDAPGFRISSDELVEGIEKSANLMEIATRLKVVGKDISRTEETSSSEPGSSPVVGGNTDAQPTASSFDSSKASQATSPLSTAGWSRAEVNNFKLDQADPPHVTGAYIDDFLRRGYPDSPLIGHGNTIKEMADYFGVAVGAAMGVWAKETVYGRSSCGGRYNFGCIMWTSNSPFPKAWAGDRNWINPPDIRSGIAAWFKLIRWSYLEPGSSFYSENYEQMLNYYSPPFENNQDTFKNLMWGQLKSFGYDMSNRTLKKNHSKANDNPLNVVTKSSGGGGSAPAPTPQPNTVVENAIKEAHRIAALRLRYQWGGNGNPSYDCSGFIQQCFKAAGVNPASSSWPRSTTYSMWAQDGKYRRISRSELRRGDLIMYDTGYTTPGDVNHVGLYLGPSLDAPNSVIHAGDPVGITQRANSMTIIGYVRVQT